MTNRKTKTIRKIRSASTIDVLSSARARNCSPISKNGSTQHPPSSHVEPPHPASSLQHPESSLQPPPAPIRKLSRNGKIARLLPQSPCCLLRAPATVRRFLKT